MGVLTSNFGSSGGDPDTTDTLVVQLAENCAALTPGSQNDADDGNTMCIIAQGSNEEVISYSACSATGQNTYTMGTYIRRGQMNTTEAAFTSGALFMRLDGSILKYTYDPVWAGRTLYFKFQAVNAFGNNAQVLSSLTPVTFTVPGANPGTVEASSGLVLQENYKGTGYGPLAWAPCYQSTWSGALNVGSSYYGYSGMSTSYGSGVIQSSFNYFYNRFTGYIIPSVTGEYTIGLNSDDGANLYIAGSQVGTDHLTTQRGMSANLTYSSGSSATILLTKGVYYPIVIEWENGVAPWGLQLLWTTPKTNSGGGVTQCIPAGNLSVVNTSISGTLNLTIWNGSAGLWYPSGTGLTDPANTTLYGPPTSSGGTNLVNSVTNVTGTESSPQVSPNTFTAANPGIQWLKGQAYSAAGIVDIFLCCGSTTQGYMFRLEYRNGLQCLISKVSNLASSLGTAITSGPANTAAKTGWVDFDIAISASGYMGLWVNDVLQCQVTDTTYAIGTTGNQVRYFYEVTSNATVGPAPASIGAGSTGLNPQSSIVTFSDYPMTYASTTSTITWSWSAFNVYFPDGSTIAVPASSGTATTNSNSGIAVSSGNKPIEFTGMGSSSTFYYSPFVEILGTSVTVCILATGASAPTLRFAIDLSVGEGQRTIAHVSCSVKVTSGRAAVGCSLTY